MALTTLELANARKARGEIESYRKIPVIVCLQFGIISLLSVSVLHDHPHRWLERFGLIFMLIVYGFLFWRLWLQYRELKSRYPANTELLESLAAREGDFVYSLEVPYQPYPPLLDAWNQRLEKRALLWRVDHFLSGKRTAP